MFQVGPGCYYQGIIFIFQLLLSMFCLLNICLTWKLTITPKSSFQSFGYVEPCIRVLIFEYAMEFWSRLCGMFLMKCWYPSSVFPRIPFIWRSPKNIEKYAIGIGSRTTFKWKHVQIMFQWFCCFLCIWLALQWTIMSKPSMINASARKWYALYVDYSLFCSVHVKFWFSSWRTYTDFSFCL